MKRGFQEFVMTYTPLSLFKTAKVFSFSLIVFRLFISSVSWISYMYGEMRTAFEWSQSNCPWHSFVCSLVPHDCHFPLMLSCWCSMHRVRTLFFESPKYFPLHEQSNWYTPGWLFGSSLGLFFREFVVDFFPTWRQYLSLFSWTQVLCLNWCLESNLIQTFHVWKVW